MQVSEKLDKLTLQFFCTHLHGGVILVHSSLSKAIMVATIKALYHGSCPRDQLLHTSRRPHLQQDFDPEGRCVHCRKIIASAVSEDAGSLDSGLSDVSKRCMPLGQRHLMGERMHSVLIQINRTVANARTHTNTHTHTSAQTQTHTHARTHMDA